MEINYSVKRIVNYTKGKYYTIIKVDNDELLPRFVLKEYSINFYVDEQHTKIIPLNGQIISIQKKNYEKQN